MTNILESLSYEIENIPDFKIIGKVSKIIGLSIEVIGIASFVSIGTQCEITSRDHRVIKAEVVAIKDDAVILMPFQDTIGIGAGCEVTVSKQNNTFYPSEALLGRVVNCYGEPIDNKGVIAKGGLAYKLKERPLPAHERRRVKDKLDMGVRVINSFVTCCKGQRMGIFAGSGVGKSMLLAMFTKFAETDVKVIGLIGERGREVQEFLDDYLGEEGLKKAVVVVATSDESALARRQAAYLVMAISEYFRDLKKEVICMIDSITRFAMAQREIGLAAGEPPTAKGYTPSVFSELPKILERAGPGTKDRGNITGLFTVLVEGDDHNEPISDAVRSILDGHILLSREVATYRYPAVDVLRSVSRTMPNCNTDIENRTIQEARKIMSLYEDMRDMIRIGAYKAGSSKEVDEAIKKHASIESFLSQGFNESDKLGEVYVKLANSLNV
jgi:flagellum-specific ATP synthase